MDFGQLGPDSNPHWKCGSRSGSRREKINYNKENNQKSKEISSLMCRMPLLRVRGFSCTVQQLRRPSWRPSDTVSEILIFG
jgi:hypothetical protein